MHRVGVIPFDTRNEAVAILFVTSQTRGRWILPKGKLTEGESHIEACHRESLEEAGVKGVVIEDYPLTALIMKQTDEGKRQIPVTYYPYLVTEQYDEWPEMDKRQRHWALIKDAPRVAYREDVLLVIRQFEDFLPWIRKVSDLHKQETPAMRMQAR